MKRKAIICDIDGTVAYNLGRIAWTEENTDLTQDDQEFWDICNERIYTDVPIKNSRELLNDYDGSILFVSARRNTFLRQTIAWLETHGYTFAEIYLMPRGANYRYWKSTIFSFLTECYNIELSIGDMPYDQYASEEHGLPFLDVEEEWPDQLPI